MKIIISLWREVEKKLGWYDGKRKVNILKKKFLDNIFFKHPRENSFFKSVVLPEA